MSWEELVVIVKGFSVLEYIAFCCSLLYVYGASKQNKYCWYPALVSTSIFMYVCFVNKLYFETILRIFYFGMAIYGLLIWNKKFVGKSKAITKRPLKFHLITIAVCLALTFVLGYLAGEFTDQESSYLDASTTVFSFATTYMVSKKMIENWLYWIVIDGASVFLYLSRELYLLAFLFAIFTLMAIYGYFLWRKDFRKMVFA